MKNITYPEIVFWNTDAELIKVINPEDFRREQYLNQIGVGGSSLSASFGTSDREEVLRRQRLIRMFVEHDGLRQAALRGLDHQSVIPSHSQSFLDHFYARGNRNLFWQRMLRIIRSTKKALQKGGRFPEEMRAFYDFLCSTQGEEEAFEKGFAAQVAEEVTKAVDLRGVIVVRKNGQYESKEFELVSDDIFGFRKYSYHLSKRYHLWQVPDWATSRWADFLKLEALAEAVVEARNRIMKKRCFAPLYVDELPGEMKNAAMRYINDEIEPKIREAAGLHRQEEALEMIFYFEYGPSGIVLRLANLEIQIGESDRDTAAPPRITADFPGYGKKERKRIEAVNERLAATTTRLGQMSRRGLAVLARITEKFPVLLAEGHAIKSKEVELNYGWSSLEGILERNEAIKEVHDQMVAYRSYVANHVAMLRRIAQIAQSFVEKSALWKRPLDWPTIEGDDQHLVSVDELWPVHLIGRRKPRSEDLIEVVDIEAVRRLAPLNGQMVVLTGLNATSKTITEEGVVNEIFGAQSGFPSFSRGVRLNVKRIVAIAFLERGEEGGSSAELLGIKTTNALRAAQAAKDNGVVVVLDEMGTGVEQGVGFDLYQRFLRGFAETGCSAIIGTQIPQLAEYAKSNLNALCFSFDAERNLTPGIGHSEEGHLIKLIGAGDVLPT